jgi:tetratricopeptide (TPR) repeat protein
LSYLDLEAEDYEKAIEKIEEALLLTLSPIQTSAAYLRLKLPENRLGFGVNYEQHPANVIEAAYINLTYAFLKSQGYEKAEKVLDEGIELFPNSTRLKHAKARFLVHKKRVDLALPIYTEISQVPSLDRYTEFEVKYFHRHIGGRKKKKAKRKTKPR